LRWRNLDIKVYGNTAITTGYVTGSITHPNGSAQLGSWRTSLVWVKTDGKWKVANDHTSELFPEQTDHTS
jgi:ketosteroid isomerase-like protein